MPTRSQYQRYKQAGCCRQCGRDNDQPLYTACSRCYTPHPTPPVAMLPQLTSQLLREAKRFGLLGDAVEAYIQRGVRCALRKQRYQARGGRKQPLSTPTPRRKPRRATQH
jgi:hypothetical protein